MLDTQQREREGGELGECAHHSPVQSSKNNVNSPLLSAKQPEVLLAGLALLQIEMPSYALSHCGSLPFRGLLFVTGATYQP